MPNVTFTKEKKTISCRKGSNLRQVAIQNGVQLYPGMKKIMNCRGHGTCGECRVHIVKGMENLGPKTFLEKFRIAVSFFKFGHEHEVRLACQAAVNGDIEVLTQPEFNWFGERPQSKKLAAAE